ncbi:hypothetical protein Tco_0759980 [Tanacetum coccineum]
MSASYSASLLEVGKSNLRAYVTSFQRGSVRIKPAPDPSLLDTPSVYNVHVCDVRSAGHCGIEPVMSWTSFIVNSATKKGLKRQKETKTVKNRQETKETRTRVKKQPKIKAGSADTARKAVKGQNNEARD